jgi:hypothetical protein
MVLHRAHGNCNPTSVDEPCPFWRGETSQSWRPCLPDRTVDVTSMTRAAQTRAENASPQDGHLKRVIGALVDRAKSLERRTLAEHRTELLREAAIMILYVAIVEIATLAALPESNLHHGRTTGTVGGALLAVVWGTAIGLALAHWFAFQVAARAFRGERHTDLDTRIALAQLGGAVLVAALSSLPALVFSDLTARQTTGDVPAALVGVVGYLLARRAGSSRLKSTFYGATVCTLGVLVALAKSLIAAH